MSNQGASGFHSTVEDLAKWTSNLQTGKIGGKILTKKMFELGKLDTGTTINA